MKKLWLLILLFPSLVFAQPFLVCDPQEGVDVYKVTWVGNPAEVSFASMDGSCYHDLASVPDGENEGEIRAGKELLLDGVGQGIYEWSSPTLFLYVNPVDTMPPVGLGLGE